MPLLWYGPECRAAVVAELVGLADEAGKLGVEVARKHCPVVTGRLRASIGYTVDRDSLTLTLYADEPYAWWVEIHTPYLRLGQAAMSEAFGGASAIQFPTLPQQYHAAARSRIRKQDFRKAVIGHRPSRGFRKP